MHKEPLIVLKNARLKTYVLKQEHLILGNKTKGLDFRLYANEHVVILGENGSGKSTLLKILKGDAWIQEGEVLWQSIENSQLVYEKTPLVGKRMCAIVSAAEQEKYIRQAWNITAEELLATGFENTLLLYNDLSKEQKNKLENLAEELNIKHLLKGYLNTFSQGQLRILLLARALISSPKVLLLDECTDGLDVEYREQVLKFLEKIRHKTTFVMTSHRLETLPRFITKKYYLKNGILSEEIPSLYLDYQVQISEDKKLALSENKKNFTNNDNSLALVPPFIEIKNASVYIDHKEILHSIDWEWKTNEHWLIYGKNGSGKSTFLKLLASEEYPALGGYIKRNLSELDDVHKLEQVKKAISLISDKLQASYAYEVNVLELILSGIDNTIGIYREFTKKEYEKANYWLEFVNMQDFAKRSIFTLSTGQARRVFMARALISKPKLLLLDEPYTGLDFTSRNEFMKLLEKLIHEGIHLLIVSHHKYDSYFCNRIARIEDGYLLVE